MTISRVLSMILVLYTPLIPIISLFSEVFRPNSSANKRASGLQNHHGCACTFRWCPASEGDVWSPPNGHPAVLAGPVCSLSAPQPQVPLWQWRGFVQQAQLSIQAHSYMPPFVIPKNKGWLLSELADHSAISAKPTAATRCWRSVGQRLLTPQAALG